jgi:glycosyltransferase involved in cell wall biosynthesis
MFRVAKGADLVVVAPVPWFPGQALIRLIKPGFRPSVPRCESQDGITVYHPRFLSVPGLFKFLDGVSEGLAVWWRLRRLGGRKRFDLIDSHFVHPDGVAAWVAGRWLNIPYTITLRGQLQWLPKRRLHLALAMRAMQSARAIFCVCNALREAAIELGVPATKLQVMPNGVNLEYFFPEDRNRSRERFGLGESDTVLISVGGLVERKGFHRVIELLPEMIREFPRLRYLIVGGPTIEGDWGPRLRSMVKQLGLEDHVKFLGPLPPQTLRFAYSSADVFVLATKAEGWANVLLEASACGLPIVTTDVGGNREVVGNHEIGIVVPFGDSAALRSAIVASLKRQWNRARIRAYAVDNAWETRVPRLMRALARAAGVRAEACDGVETA